jgi:hypothetical protein
VVVVVVVVMVVVVVVVVVVVLVLVFVLVVVMSIFTINLVIDDFSLFFGGMGFEAPCIGTGKVQ